MNWAIIHNWCEIEMTCMHILIFCLIVLNLFKRYTYTMTPFLLLKYSLALCATQFFRSSLFLCEIAHQLSYPSYQRNVNLVSYNVWIKYDRTGGGILIYGILSCFAWRPGNSIMHTSGIISSKVRYVTIKPLYIKSRLSVTIPQHKIWGGKVFGKIWYSSSRSSITKVCKGYLGKRLPRSLLLPSVNKGWCKHVFCSLQRLALSNLIFQHSCPSLLHDGFFYCEKKFPSFNLRQPWKKGHFWEKPATE